MVEEEFFGVDERPDDVFVGHTGWVFRFCFAVLVGDGRGNGLFAVQILEGDLEFVIRWVAAECHKVEFSDFFSMGAAVVLGPLRGSAGVGGKFFLECFRIEQVKALREAGVLGSFAFARAGGVGTAKDGEKVVVVVESVVRQFDGFGVGWQAVKGRRGAEHFVDGVVERFGHETFGVVAGEVLFVYAVVLVGYGSELVGLGLANPANERFEVVSRMDKAPGKRF